MSHKKAEQSKTSGKALRILGRAVLWLVCGLVLVLSLAVIGIWSLCLFREEYVAAEAGRRLRAYTGQPWRVKGPVLPQLFPHPGISLHNVSLLAVSESRELEAGQAPPFVTVEKIKVSLDPLALLHGRVQLKTVDIRSARISLAYGLDGAPLWERNPLEEFDYLGDEELDEQIALHELELTALPAPGGGQADRAPVPADGKADRTPAPAKGTRDNALPSPKDVAAEERQGEHGQPPVSPAYATRSGRISVLQPILAQAAELLDPDFREYLPALAVSDALFSYYNQQGDLVIRIGGGEAYFDPLAGDSPLVFSGFTAMPSVGISLGFYGAVDLGEDLSLLQGHIQGRMRMAPEELLERFVDYSFPFSWKKSGTQVSIHGLVLASGDDMVSADLSLDLLEASITGPAHVRHANMPRWFKFARNLPPGLQHAMADLSGSLDLLLTLDGVWGRNGVFKAKDLPLTGTVHASDFSKPVVVVDLDIPFVNLDHVFPFLATSEAEVPEWEDLVFDYPHLVPYPGEAGANVPDVGYDVTVRVARGQVHDIAVDKAVVKCFPDKDDNAIVTFRIPGFLRGGLDGRLFIGEREVRMTYDADKLDISLTPENKSGNAVFAGLFSGNVDILVNVDENDVWLDPWGLKVTGELVKAGIGGRGSGKWRLNSKNIGLEGGGEVFTNRVEGIKAVGVWNIRGKGISSSWNPGGNDHLDGTLNGTIAWAPQPPPQAGGKPAKYWRGVAGVFGDLSGSGVLGLPISSQVSPTSGKFTTALNWNLITDQVDLAKTSFEGMGGLYQGDVMINLAGDPVYEARLDVNMQPKVLLRAWKMVPESFELPDLVAGSGKLKGGGEGVEITDLNVKVDGSPVRGSVIKKNTGTVPVPKSIADKSKASGRTALSVMGAGAWSASLEADLLDLDKYLPPAPKGTPPSRAPWDFDFLYGQDIDARVAFKALRYKKLIASNAGLVFSLKKEILLAQFTSPSFYGGQLDIKAQGEMSPLRSEVRLARGQGGARNFDLARLFTDMNGEASSYGGKAEIQFDLNGLMRSNADLPGNLSGHWGLLIKDGMYPAFLGSEGGLRNTFSNAAVSGVMEKGVMRWNNFTLKSAMIDMKGNGQVDLNDNTLDISISATVARVPTIPMRITGNIDSPKMTVRGEAILVENVSSAGSTIFGLVKGILELPLRAVQGMGDLLSGGKKDEAAGRPAPGGATRNSQDVRR